MTHPPSPTSTNLDLHLGPAGLADERDDPEGQRNVLGGAVAHQFVLAVWRDEADGVLRLELGQFDALVELAVVYSDAGTTRASGVVPGTWERDRAGRGAREKRVILGSSERGGGCRDETQMPWIKVLECETPCA